MAGSATSEKVVLLEFNELCPSLLQKWMADGSLPNFKKFFEGSQSFITVADAEPPALEPWIQWYSLHTGLSFEQHGVFRLTDGPQAPYRDIWEVVRQAGLTAFNCSSMNAKSFAEGDNIFLPDPWCTSEAAYPEELNRFHGFVAKQVQEYTNSQSGSRLAELSGFGSFLLTHGLRPKTVGRVASQLLSEKLYDCNLHWKRAVVLDWLQTDLFLHYWKKRRPNFSTFFLNSTAHFQHSYWRYMQPELFGSRTDSNEAQRFGNAIHFGYLNMDRLLADFLRLEHDHGATLVLASGLSQQPYLKYEPIGGQRFYRPYNIGKLLEHCGVRPIAVEPTMTHQYMAHFDSRAARDAAATILESMACGDQPVFDVTRKAKDALYFGCQLRTEVPNGATVRFGANVGKELPFYDLFYMIDQTKSGFHHPDGIFWVRSGTSFAQPEKVSLLDVFPTLLDLLGINYQASEAHPFSGTSLLSGYARQNAPADLLEQRA